MTIHNSPSINIVYERIFAYGELPALIWRDKEYSYKDLTCLIQKWTDRLIADGVKQGSICAFKGDFSPNTCALILSLIKLQAILVPLTNEVSVEIQSYMKIAGVQFLYTFNEFDEYSFTPIPDYEAPELVTKFRLRNRPGLIVFTSGSTGKPKGILHDCEMIFRKFEKPRKSWRTILFLLMDHFGGFNTFLSVFTNGGVGICLEGRTAAIVTKSISDHIATLLPTTPTFLNLLIANQAYHKKNLSSVELITYGTELMPETTLQKCLEIFPNAIFKQTYGLSELGVLHSSSKGNESVWVKIGGPGFEIKVIEDILWIRSESNMVGYLNEKNPFDNEGWLCTGDKVEMQNGYIRFLGRKSEVINVGGKKVHPVEVENVLMQAKNIKFVTVFGKKHPIMGEVVHAKITLLVDEEHVSVTERLRTFCNERMAQYKVPIRFQIIPDNEHHNNRFKKIRREKAVDENI